MTRSHAILDCESREKKAIKIERLVSAMYTLKRSKMLEVGCGSGKIASYFSGLGYGQAGTHAIDVVDERQVTGDFQFTLVSDTNLPFDDEHFDFVISNHVIEHVGDEAAQKHHLAEIFRCLSPGEVFYFAVPNRWRLIEPHYKLPFLSWFPVWLASLYVRLLAKGTHYDCRPLSKRQAEALLKGSGFECWDVTLDAISLVGEIEGGWATSRIAKLPKSIWKPLAFLVPTLIFVCRKPAT